LWKKKCRIAENPVKSTYASLCDITKKNDKSAIYLPWQYMQVADLGVRPKGYGGEAGHSGSV
jgi:hypothetical protein